MAINPVKLNEFLRHGVDLGAVFHAAMVTIADQVGLYKALAAGDS
jgi:hypothetical protein